MEILVKFSGCIVRLLALKLHLSQSEICIPKYAFGKKKKKFGCCVGLCWNEC